MSIKDLFSKQKSQSQQFRGANKKSLDEFRQDIESSEEVKQIRIEDSLIQPDLNYASASSFVKYGSAKKYYEDAIKRIYNQYPYDGSNAEKIAFRNEITQLERHILDVDYPKSTGFAVFSPDGWGTNDGTNSVGFYSSSLPEHITAFGYQKDQIWNTTSSQQQSFRLDFTEGFTVEFWLKKGSFGVAGGSEAIFDIRGTVEPSGSAFGAYMISSAGTSNLISYYNNPSDTFILNLSTGLGTSDTDWHHYAIVYGYTGSTYTANLYLDGEFVNSTTATSVNVAQTGSLKLTVGALGGDFYNILPATPAGFGKLSGSLDEFRFWQEPRNAQEIGRNYFSVVNGGGNTDTNKVNNDNPLKLACYFKFNEGKTGALSTDSTVLDYSGRLANGVWTGYVSNSRDTGSAIVQSGVGAEKGDPIIYSIHPDVDALSSNLEASGTQYDAENVGSLQDSIPLWMMDEDLNQGGEIQNLLQVLGSYLDSLYLQITQMVKFHEAEYQDNNSVAANPHNRRLLTSLGFDIPEMFIDKRVLETILDQDDKRKFEDKLNEIKNLIYKNIYNNLNYINKSKGTIKSVRNLLRCYGIDDDLFNFNVYADKAEYFIKDDYKNSSIKFDSLDLTPFADNQNTQGVIYNFAEAGNADTAPFISGSTDDIYLPFTVESNAIFPKIPPTYHDSVQLTEPAIVTASIFGIRQAQDANSTTVPSPDLANISVRVVKDDNTAKFQLSSSLGVLLESDRFYDVYDNSRWSLSVRVKYDLDPFTVVSGSGPWTLEFNGYNYIQDVLQNSFSLNSALTSAQGTGFTGADKRIYAGAEKENITGSLTHRANMKLLSVLAWADYLEDDELKSHSRDVTSFGRARPYKNSFSFRGNNLDTIFIPKFDSLAMNLAFNQVTSSDSSGEFVVPDLSSGSLTFTTKYPAENYSKIVGIQHTAEGKGFPVSSDVKDIQYLNIMTQQIPENLNTDNMIEILARDDDKFFIDARPVKYFFSLEASMYDTISREMLKTFAGVLDYASMIGSPIVDHQVFHKEMRLARQNFFERVENEPDLEKYVQLYKFLDSAIESVLFNLMPASANASERVRTVIENHLFERSHVSRILPPGRKIDTQNKIGNKTVSGHSPGVANPIAPYESYYEDASTDVKPKDVVGEDFIESFKNFNTHVQGSTFALETRRRDFPKFKGSKNPVSERNIETYLNRYENKRNENAVDTDGQNAFYKLRAKRDREDLDVYSTDPPLKSRASIHSTYQREKHIDITRGAKVKGNILSNTIGPDDASTRDGNVILPIIQTEEAKNTITLTRTETPNISSDITKNFTTYNVGITNTTSDVESVNLVQNNLPLKFAEQSAGAGFFSGGVGAVLNGHHTDIFYSTQEPLQGPFTEQHVGGYKHRHIEVAETDDRPELFKVTATTGEVTTIHNPRSDDAATTYDFNIPRVKFSRDETIKRVYNVKNIATTTGSKTLGNFDKNYQVVMTNGRRQNNFAFVQQNGFDITESESTAVSGVLDFELPNRSLSNGTFNKTVIVNRFSAPGEVATLSEGFLDVEAAELSPYNALPFRNRDPVNSLNDFLAKPSAFGGYQSGSTVTASYHKVQRNRVNRIKESAPGTKFTGSFEDNGFFNYQIPKKDFGYWWINTSADPELSMDGLYGYAANSINTSSYGITFFSGALRGDEENQIINFAYYSTPASKIGSHGYHYEITENSNLILAPTAYTGVEQPTSASIYFLNINGPYGYPSFKQGRTGEHPIARSIKENNVIIASTAADEMRVVHSPVSSKYKPMLHLLKSMEKFGGVPTEKDLILTYPFASEYDFYGNYYDTVNDDLRNPYPSKNFKILDKRDSLFYNISSLYTGKSTIENVNNIKLISLFYSETIYPKETNAYLSKVRDRNTFIFNWRDSLDDRVAKLNGSQEGGGFQSYSLWSMDVDGDNIGDSTKRGELVNRDQDTATQGGSIGDLNVRFGRYYLSGSTGFVNITSSLPRNTVHFGTVDSAQQGPFDDNYSIWNSELRTIAKDHSIIPEYRISEYVESVVDAGRDLLNDNYQSLSLTGSQSTENNNVFLETFAHSDDIPAIEIVREIQQRDAKTISLKISAAKKLLPYDGFYPSQRTLQLSTLFSQSVQPDATLAGSVASFQTLNNVVFSRLTYGSIRAGTAIDSANWVNGPLVTGGEIEDANNQKWNRIPFEAIIDPASYLNPSSLIVENDYENTFNSTASVGYIDSNYGLAASNFYAGVVDTFIEDSVLTSIKSKPESEWKFTQGNFDNYSLDIVVSKKSNFSNHDDPSANGYPYAVHSCYYQSILSTTGGGLDWVGLENEEIRRTNGYVQPNASWAYNEAIVNINFDYNSFRTAVTDRDPTLNDIMFYSTKTYKNKQMDDADLTLAKGFGTSSVNSSSPFMTIEAGVDLFVSNNIGQWTPTLRWECPTHNYVSVTALYPDGTSGGDGDAITDVNRGVWHQYSTDTNSGLKLFARGPETSAARTTGSLATAVGFEIEQKVVSQLSKSAELKEFLIVIPFVTNECQEETFFHYPIDQFERAYSNIDKDNRGSLSTMLATQRELILPPRLNYMDARDASAHRLEQDEYGQILPPFAMYIFEVTENLSQEDLSKWWQGVLPSAGTKVAMEQFNINHKIEEGEIISPSVLNNDIFGGKLPKEMRFKIFKAKYRRNFTYDDIKNKSIYGTEPNNPVLGYNYPHDFYSLIEMAKVDIGLEYDGDEE